MAEISSRGNAAATELSKASEGVALAGWRDYHRAAIFPHQRHATELQNPNGFASFAGRRAEVAAGGDELS